MRDTQEVASFRQSLNARLQASETLSNALEEQLTRRFPKHSRWDRKAVLGPTVKLIAHRMTYVTGEILRRLKKVIFSSFLWTRFWLWVLQRLQSKSKCETLSTLTTVEKTSFIASPRAYDHLVHFCITKYVSFLVLSLTLKSLVQDWLLDYISLFYVFSIGVDYGTSVLTLCFLSHLRVHYCSEIPVKYAWFLYHMGVRCHSMYCYIVQ